MSYCTEADLDRVYGSEDITLLADHDRDGDRDTEVVTRALAWADHLIESKLAAAIPLPLTAPYPPRLVDIAIDLAYYRLFRVATDDAMTRFKAAVAQLDAIRDGKETLGLDGSGADLQAQALDVAYAGPDRVFTAAEMEGY